jgi:hypothetical protein
VAFGAAWLNAHTYALHFTFFKVGAATGLFPTTPALPMGQIQNLKNTYLWLLLSELFVFAAFPTLICMLFR